MAAVSNSTSTPPGVGERRASQGSISAADCIREHNRRVSVGGAVVKLVRSMTQQSITSGEARDASQKEQDVLLKTFKKSPEFYSAKSVADVLEELQVNAHTGLSEERDIPARLEKHGPNELLKPPPRRWYHMLADQFKDPLIIILLAASAFAMAAGGLTEGIVILAIVFLNACIGVQQEGKSEDAIAKLQEITEDTCVVRRDGEASKIDKRRLVPGDLVILRVGSKVPADGRVIKGSNNFRVMEAMLTGESRPVKKVSNGRGAFGDVAAANASGSEEEADEDDEKSKFGQTPKGADAKVETASTMLYMGTEVVQGAGEMVVVRTGMNTKMGNITHLLASTESKQSPLQEKLADLGEKLGIYGILVCCVVLAVGIPTERGADPNSDQAIWLQMLLITVSLIVAFVPEGLPVVTAITLATGMGQMAHKNCIIKNLKSVETMGNASVICSDKTGTLTTGIQKMEQLLMMGKKGVKRFQISGEGYSTRGEVTPLDDEAKFEDNSPELTRAFIVAGLCNQATVTVTQDASGRPKYEATGNLTDRACAVAAIIGGVEKSQNRARILQTNEHDSVRKSMSAVVEYLATDGIFPANSNQVLIKGAPNVLLPRCSHHYLDGVRTPLDKEAAKLIANSIDNLSDQAYRVLLFATRTTDDVKTDGSMDPSTVENDMDFVALGAIIDPEREGVKEAIEVAAQAQVRTMMITGDYYKTAVAIANRLGLLARRTEEEEQLTIGDMAVDASELDKLLATAAKQLPDAELIPYRQAKETMDDLTAQLARARQQLEQASSDNEQADLKSTVNGIKGKLRDADKEFKQATLTKEKKVRALYIDELTRLAQKLRVVARAQPRHKLDLVEALQATGDTVSMTGDGVNDAPALKQADIGLAMGITGTDVAKAAADAIITDDNFVTIVEAIKEGRRIYANIGKFVYFLLSTNIAEVFVITIAAIAGMVSPLRPTQILWLNLMTDSSPALALAMDDFDPMLMKQPPRNRNVPLIDKTMWISIWIHTVILTAVCLGTYIVGLRWHTETWDGVINTEGLGKAAEDEAEDLLQKAQTMEIYVIVFAELLRAYSSRNLIRDVFDGGIFQNNYLQFAVGFSILFTILVGVIPGAQEVFGMQNLDGKSWGLVVGLSFVPIFADEVVKWIYRKMGCFGYKPPAVTTS